MLLAGMLSYNAHSMQKLQCSEEDYRRWSEWTRERNGDDSGYDADVSSMYDDTSKTDENSDADTKSIFDPDMAFIEDNSCCKNGPTNCEELLPKLFPNGLIPVYMPCKKKVIERLKDMPREEFNRWLREIDKKNQERKEYNKPKKATNTYKKGKMIEQKTWAGAKRYKSGQSGDRWNTLGEMTREEFGSLKRHIVKETQEIKRNEAIELDKQFPRPTSTMSLRLKIWGFEPLVSRRAAQQQTEQYNWDEWDPFCFGYQGN